MLRSTVALWCLGLLTTVGCCSRQYWTAPARPCQIGHRPTFSHLADAVHSLGICGSTQPVAPGACPISLARAYAESGAHNDRKRSIDAAWHYYQAAAFAYQAMDCELPGSERWRECSGLYHQSIARMLTVAQRHQLLRQGALHLPRSGIAPAAIAIPIQTHDFAWQLDDFQQIHPVGDYNSKLLSRTYRAEGWGVPVVVQRCEPTHRYVEESFLRRGTTFAATALLRWDGRGPTLEFHNPLVSRTIAFHDCIGPLARDLSAPLAFRSLARSERSTPIADYMNMSDSSEHEGLFLLEPYQPGKIPLVLVHGLMSNPETWMDMANDIRATPGFAARFQIWGFRYSTGRPFLGSAARLRQDLHALTTAVDKGDDPALHQMVLAGHSMGGLICKLQATDSGDTLWRAAANRPFDQIAADPATRERLAEVFFFNANPRIQRIVFIATPHQGSAWARRPIGRVASCLAKPSAIDRAQHARLLAENPGVFSRELQGRFPTSVDMLSPYSPLLQAIRCLRVPPGVQVHTVYGDGGCSLREATDGVVSAQSATTAEAVSQVAVDARHTEIHRKLATTDELVRILQQHLRTPSD